jgi:hypothetical protein
MSASACSSLRASSGERWPTPSAALTNDQEEPETFLARQEALKAKGINGNGAGTPLTMAAKLWPTPEGIRDAKSSGTRALLERRQAESARGQPLVEVACHWPSPQARDADNRGADPARVGDPARHGGYNLDDWAAAWPTQRACSGERSSGLNRTEMVRAWTTPPWSHPDHQTGNDGPKSLREAMASRRLSLNPSFVEWLMGWPLGWTDCGSPVTGFSRWLQRQRTALSELNWNYEPAPDAEPEPLQLELV